MTSTELISDLDPTIFPVGRFKPLRKLKDNQAGGTLLCYDDFLEQNVVIKLIGEIDMDNLMRLQRDALTLCKLSNKGMAKLIDFGATTGGIAYLVYDYRAGENFRTYLDEQQPLSLQHTFKAFIPVVEALGSMHSNGILHWDLRCSNLMLINTTSVESSLVLLNSATGRLRLATKEPITVDGRKVYGSPQYMPPEQAVNEYDVRSEIFSLGCTIFEAIAGRTPYVGESEETISRMIRRGPPSLTQVSEGMSYPHKVEGLIAKMLAKNPDSRFQTMQGVRQALLELSTQVLTVEPKAHPVRAKSRSEPDSNADSRQSPGQKEWPNREQRISTIEKSQFTDDAQGSSTRQLDPNGIRLVVSESDEELVRESSDSSLSIAELKIVADDNQQSGEPPSEASASKTDSSSTQNVTATANDSIKNQGPNEAVSTPAKNSSASNNPLNAPVATFNGNFLVSSIPQDNRQTEREPTWLQVLNATSELRRYRALLAIFCLLVICFASTVWSYVNFLAAPRIKADGVISYYKPASPYEPGMVELTMAEDGSTLPIMIERPELNLPPIPNPEWTEDPSMQPSELWGRDAFSMTRTATIPENRDRAIRLGEAWTLEYRIDNGKLVLEGRKFDGLADATEKLDELESTIDTMLKDLPFPTTFPSSQAFEAQRASWAYDDFLSKVDLTSTDVRAANIDKLRHQFSPTEDLKLIDMNGSYCTLLLRSPAWLEARTPYLKVSLLRNPRWQVTTIVPSSITEWNREVGEEGGYEE